MAWNCELNGVVVKDVNVTNSRRQSCCGVTLTIFRFVTVLTLYVNANTTCFCFSFMFFVLLFCLNCLIVSVDALECNSTTIVRTSTGTSTYSYPYECTQYCVPCSYGYSHRRLCLGYNEDMTFLRLRKRLKIVDYEFDSFFWNRWLNMF